MKEARERQRRRRIRLAALAAALLAGVAAAIGIFSGSPSHPLTVGEIAAREAAALKSSDRRVVRMTIKSAIHTTSATRFGYSVEWADLATLRTRTITEFPGQPRRQETMRYFVIDDHVAGEAATGDVFYSSRTSFTYSRAWIAYISRGARRANPPASLTETVPEGLLAHGSLAILAPVVSNGPGPGSPWVYRIVSRDEINGQPAVELQTRWPKSDLVAMRSRGWPAKIVRNDAVARYDVWISVTSYLPIRLRYFQGTRLGWTEDFAWLPASKASLALLNLKVPTGFTHSVVNCRVEGPPKGCGYGFGG